MTNGAWPHQAVLPAYRCLGHNYRTMYFFCQELSLTPSTHAVRRDTPEMTVYRFGPREHAKQFCDRFGGELIDLATRPRRRRTRVQLGDLCAQSSASGTAAASIATTE